MESTGQTCPINGGPTTQHIAPKGATANVQVSDTTAQPQSSCGVMCRGGGAAQVEQSKPIQY